MVKKKQRKNNYSTFIENIQKGNFVLPYCKKCKKNIWPPSDNCRLCLANLIIENCNNKRGKILEILASKINNNVLVVLVEIHTVILLGSLFLENNTNARDNIKGDMVKIKKCGFVDNKIYYEFMLCK